MMHNSLNLLDDQHRLPPKLPKMYQTMGLVYGPYFFLADKPKGIEPGFLAVEFTPDLILRVQQAFQLTQPFANLEDCKQFLNQVSQSADRSALVTFAKLLLKEGMGKEPVPANSPSLPLILVKQDYHEKNFLGVRPPLRRIRETSSFKGVPEFFIKIYSFFRYRSTTKENTNAILETLATDVARAFGMPVQKQSLLLGNYHNGDCKIMSAAEWDADIKGIDAYGGTELYGLYENYILETDADGKALVNHGLQKSDGGIRNLGECLPLFISQGDRDVFGSKAENKLLKGNSLFGIDFGKAFRPNNPILKTLDDDFNFVQPRFKSAKFKNLSICYDSSMKERMSGLFFLYKMLGAQAGFNAKERKNIERAIQEYKNTVPGFSERYEQVVADSYMKIFSDYEKKFMALKATAPNAKLKSEYATYARSIKAAQSYALEDTKALLKRFSAKMQLAPDELELIDNLKKFSCETSNVSGDHRVELNHLRILRNPGIRWTIEKEGELYKLNADLPPSSAESLRKQLSTYIQQTQIPDQRQREGNKLEYRLGREQFKKWVSAFKEENIKVYKLSGQAPAFSTITVAKPEAPRTREFSALSLTKLDELIQKFEHLKKQRQPEAVTETKILSLLSDSQLIRGRLARDQQDDFSPFIRRTEDELNAIINRRAAQSEPAFNRSPRASTLTHFKSRASTVTKNSAKPDLAQLLMNTLSKNQQRLLANRLEQRSQLPSVYDFLVRALAHLRKRDGAITEVGFERVCAAMIKTNRDFNPLLVASSLYKAYRRGTEQLDPYAEDKSEDPYCSSLYLPNDDYILAAKNEVEKQVTLGASTITLDPNVDEHEREAVALYCRYKGYDHKADDYKALPEKDKAFAELFEKRFKEPEVRDEKSAGLNSKS